MDLISRGENSDINAQIAEKRDSTAGVKEMSELPATMSSFTQRQGTPKKGSNYRGSVLRKYESSDDDESSNESDSDDEQLWKRRKTTAGPPVSHRPHRRDFHMRSDGERGRSSSAIDRSGGSRMGAKTRVNNVWGTIVQEQRQEQVEREITHFGMEFDSRRDVESYNYLVDPDSEGRPPQIGLLSGIPIDGDASNRGREIQKGVGEGEDDGWLAERGSPVPSDEDDVEIDMAADLRERIASGKMVADQIRKPGIKSRLGSRQSNDTSEMPEMRSVEIDPNGEPKVVAGQLAYSLQESKRNLMLRIVKILGVKKSLEIWQQTEEIEKDGGMMVRDCSRKRSPGGVFIQLMKTDPDITKDDIKAIFAEEKKVFDEERKKKRRRMRKFASSSMHVDKKRDMDKERDDGYDEVMERRKDNMEMDSKEEVNFLFPKQDSVKDIQKKNEDSEPEEGELTDDDDGEGNIADNDVDKDDSHMTKGTDIKFTDEVVDDVK